MIAFMCYTSAFLLMQATLVLNASKFTVIGECSLYGYDLREDVIKYFCGTCKMLTGTRSILFECSSGSYWTDVTQCMDGPDANGIIGPSQVQAPCNERHALICECEDESSTCSPTSSPVSA